MSCASIPAAQYLRMSAEHQQYSFENQTVSIGRTDLGLPCTALGWNAGNNWKAYPNSATLCAAFAERRDEYDAEAIGFFYHANLQTRACSRSHSCCAVCANVR